MSTPSAFVYVELAGEPHLVGMLHVQVARGREHATFTYAPTWQANPERFALAPALALSPAPYYTDPGQSLFGALSDSAPDRWGRTLMRRAERRRAERDGTAPRALREIDFLLGVHDVTRQGALRFATTEGGLFVASDGVDRVPPLVALPRLLAATDGVLAEDESADDLRLLLAPGSSLGGARPKASVSGPDGRLYIAKFPRVDDEYPVVTWEAVALDLARAAGITTPTYHLDAVAGRPVLILERFEREGEARVPYLSAMSLLNAKDGDSRSYVDIADALRLHGARAMSDLAELWRRVVFSILVSNTDDHLRNHGVLYAGAAGWHLSPVFDVNPVPLDVKARVLSTPIDADGDPTASLALALAAAPAFGLSPSTARAIARTVGQAVSTWRAVAARRGLSPAALTRMASAMEHADLAAALAL